MWSTKWIWYLMKNWYWWWAGELHGCSPAFLASCISLTAVYHWHCLSTTLNLGSPVTFFENVVWDDISCRLWQVFKPFRALKHLPKNHSLAQFSVSLLSICSLWKRIAESYSKISMCSIVFFCATKMRDVDFCLLQLW